MEPKHWIEIGAVVVMLVAVGGTIWNRTSLEKGLGTKVTKFMLVCLVVPSVLVLALEQKVSSESAVAILATIVGYVLGQGRESADK
jgi:hypothetical protein